MPVKVPNFAALVAARPVDSGLPSSAIIAGAASNTLLSLSASAAEHKQAKQSIYGFADAMQDSSPQAATMYRAMADNMPAFDLSSVINGPSGGGGGGRRGAAGMSGPSFGGITGSIMEDMMKEINTQRQVSAELTIDNAKTQNDMARMGYGHGLEIQRIAAGFEKEKTLGILSFGNHAALEMLKQEGDKAQDARHLERINAEIEQRKEYQGFLEQQLEVSREGNKVETMKAQTNAFRTAAQAAGMGYFGKSDKSATAPSIARIQSYISTTPLLRGRWDEANREWGSATDAETKRAAEAKMKSIQMDAYNQISRVPSSLTPNQGSGMGNASNVNDALGGFLNQFK